MTKYKQTNFEGTIDRWQKARQIVLDNPTESDPSLMCYEMEVTKYPDGSIQEKLLGSLNYTMNDPSVEIPLVDPETFEPTENSFTGDQYWLMSASVYLWLSRQQSNSSSNP